jgi:flagellar biosynthesis/type III secretory pathway M-ring protein FliF/YscJ
MGERGLAGLPGNTPPAALAAPAGQRPTTSGDDSGVHLDPEARQRAELVKRARGVIEDAPDEAVAIIRSWLHET